MRRLIGIGGMASLAAVIWLWPLGGAAWLAGVAAGWQHQVQNAMAGAIRGLQGGRPGALAALWGLCLAYGFFHAAGPGHGKLVIGAYGLGRRVPLGRLAGLALAASLAQALTAVALVGAGVLLLGLQRQQMQGLADRTLAQVSALMIGIIGLWLIWRGARGVWRMWPAAGRHAPYGAAGRRASFDAAGQNAPFEAADRNAPFDAAGRQAPFGAAGRHAPFGAVGQNAPFGAVGKNAPFGAVGSAHPLVPDLAGLGQLMPPAATEPEVCATCGHAHGPTLAEVAQVRGWRDGLAIVAAIAARPCTGALFLLILTWQLGLFWAGVMGALVMGLGTASVTLVVALGAVSLRESALLRAATGHGVVRGMALAEVLAGVVIIALALQMLRMAG